MGETQEADLKRNKCSHVVHVTLEQASGAWGAKIVLPGMSSETNHQTKLKQPRDGLNGT